MANCLNRAQIIGNLTRDPEVRTTSTGIKVCSIGVATNRKWTDRQTGAPKEEVEFHNVVAWDRLAGICEQYLHKGTKVFFEGRLRTNKWEDENGKNHYKTEIIAENMIMLSSRGENSGSYSPPPPPAPAPTAPADNPPAAEPATPQAVPAKNPPADSAEEQKEEVKVNDLPF